MSKKERKSLALGLYSNEKNEYSKRVLSVALKISESSLYYKSKLDKTDLIIKGKIEDFYEFDDTLGSRKLANLLDYSRSKISRIMLKYDIIPRKKRKQYKYAGRSDEIVDNKLLNIKNLSDYDIVFSDIFEFRLFSGRKVYCCFMLRSKTRQILSFSYGTQMPSELVVSSLKHIDLINLNSSEIIFHSDQGKQYGSELTVKQLIESQFDHSMSRAGTPTDNGYTERFVGIFKHSVTERYSYNSLEEFEEFGTRWLNFYNQVRPQQSLGQISPNDFAESKGYKKVQTLALNLL